MNRRDVLTNFGEGNPGHTHGPAPQDLHIELAASDHEEPTWEVHRPGTPRRRFDRRARAIVTVAAVGALLANAGAAWAYWRFTGPDTPAAQPQQQVVAPAAGSPFAITLSGSSDPNQVLLPGASGNLTVTVTNQHPVPIQITSIMPGAGPAQADQAHSEAGCARPPVVINKARFPVVWEVPRNTVGAFILPGALTMRAGGPTACQGAVFTVSVRAQAVRP